MDVRLYSWTGTNVEQSSENSDIARAQVCYGFDRPTAERLAFVRWLYRCGRLDDG
jgi:hypothetical protein